MLTGRAMKTAVAFASNCDATVGRSQGRANKNGKELFQSAHHHTFARGSTSATRIEKI